MDEKLPELPQPYIYSPSGQPTYSKWQMREYAIECLAGEAFAVFANAHQALSNENQALREALWEFVPECSRGQLTDTERIEKARAALKPVPLSGDGDSA